MNVFHQRGFYPDILFEVLTFATRKQLAKLELISFLFHAMISKHFKYRPYFPLYEVELDCVRFLSGRVN